VVKKVLIAYSSKPPIANYLASSFSKIGIESKIFFADENHWFDRCVINKINKQLHNFRITPKNKNLFSNHPLAHKNFRSANLVKAFDEFAPNLVVIIRGINFSKESLEYISGKSKVFGWWVEKEERVEEALSEIEYFNHYFFINSSCVDTAHRRGRQDISLLHHSVDTNSFYKLPSIDKKIDICFVGNWSKKRQTIVEALLKVTDNISIFGGKWLQKNILKPQLLRCIKGSYIEGEELNLLYNQSRVVLNVTNWGFGEGNKRSGMNMRILEVPATGSFLLTDSSKDLEAVITPSTHLAVYKDLDECVQKARYYLQNESEREQIAQNGLGFVKERYNYDNLVGEMIKTYKMQSNSES